jgi:hypothetical protein
MIRHIVIFKYRNDATPEQVKTISDAFWALKDRIPGIIGFEAGVNNSPENLNHSFTHIFQLTFTDVAARDAYLPHPEHKAFGETLRSLGILEEVFVIDYDPA